MSDETTDNKLPVCEDTATVLARVLRDIDQLAGRQGQFAANTVIAAVVQFFGWKP